MTTKLTLSIDATIAELAKRAANARNTSVSAMLFRFVLGLDAMNKAGSAQAIAPVTLAATGLARRPSGQDLCLKPDTGATDARTDETLLEEALWERYGPLECPGLSEGAIADFGARRIPGPVRRRQMLRCWLAM